VGFRRVTCDVTGYDLSFFFADEVRFLSRPRMLIGLTFKSTRALLNRRTSAYGSSITCSASPLLRFAALVRPATYHTLSVSLISLLETSGNWVALQRGWEGYFNWTGRGSISNFNIRVTCDLLLFLFTSRIE